MNLQKNLIIRVKNFNSICNDVILMKSLRKLTLHHFSGMNYELNNFEKLAKIRNVKAQVLMAYLNDELVGWSLLSKEPSNFLFGKSLKTYDPSYGMLFQIYIAPLHRRKGIGSELLKVARRKASPYRLCFCPWNNASTKFYSNFNYHWNISL